MLIVRTAPGILILFKGIIFLSDMALLQHSALAWFALNFRVYYVAFANLFCGVFIIIGLLTRIVLFIQLPVLAGAVFFINPGGHFFAFNGKFFLSLAVLIATCYFLVEGCGKISMNNYLLANEL